MLTLFTLDRATLARIVAKTSAKAGQSNRQTFEPTLHALIQPSRRHRQVVEASGPGGFVRCFQVKPKTKIVEIVTIAAKHPPVPPSVSDPTRWDPSSLSVGISVLSNGPNLFDLFSVGSHEDSLVVLVGGSGSLGAARSWQVRKIEAFLKFVRQDIGSLNDVALIVAIEPMGRPIWSVHDDCLDTKPPILMPGNVDFAGVSHPLTVVQISDSIGIRRKIDMVVTDGRTVPH